MLSIRSRKPPCPGTPLPESFTPILRLNRDFFRSHKEVVIGGKPVKLVAFEHLKLFEPKEFALEKTTVWSFENRGKWATY